MSSILVIFLSMAAFCLFMLVRNEIVFRVRGLRIEAISEATRRDIGHEHFYRRMYARYAELDAPSYDAMLFKFGCWTYRQFYPSDPV